MPKVSKSAPLSTAITVPSNALAAKLISATCACKIATVHFDAAKLNLLLLKLGPARARAREKVKARERAGVDKLHKARILRLTSLT